MLVFWIVIAVLIALVLATILRALLKPQANTSVSSYDEKRAIFRQQFDELAQDKINGVLDAAQYEVAKTELERRMLDEVGTAVSASSAKPDITLALVLSVAVPLLSIFLYYKIGTPAAITIPVVDSNTTAQSTMEHNAMAGDIEPLLEALKAKLEKNPENGEGWALLARTYVELRRHPEAVSAYEKAVKSIIDDPQLYADYADALGVVSGNNLAGKPEELVNKALELDPHNTKALMLAGTVAYDRKNYKQAIVWWERMQKILPADSDLLPDVKAALAETYALSGEKPPAASTETSSIAIAADTSISGTVSIAPALANQVSPNDTVFIFARPTQGKPMPLAIVRAMVKELPYQFKLDDSTAIMPSHKLSQASEVVLVARISKTGDATSQAGDLQGVSEVVKPKGAAVNIEINQVVK